MGFDAISGPNWIVPTAPAGDSSNRVANTAFVAAAVVAGPTGGVLQIKYAETTSVVAQTTAMAGTNDTIPVNTDGTQILSVTLTPSATANNLLVTGLAPLAASVAPSNMWIAVFQDANQTALAALEFGSGNQNVVTPAEVICQVAAGTTGPTTLTLRCGNFVGNNATWALNARASPVARRLGGASRATLTVQETKV